MPASADATSVRTRARITGVIYLLYFLTAVSSVAFVGRGRPLAYEVVNLVSFAFYIAVTLRFYALFAPVSRRLSLLAAILGLAGCAVEALTLFELAPFKLSSLVFFGPYCVLLGLLVVRSTFLPRALGVLLVLAGVGWLVVLSPLAGPLATPIKVLGFLAEAGLMLWLVAFGVDGRRWADLARQGG